MFCLRHIRWRGLVWILGLLIDSCLPVQELKRVKISEIMGISIPNSIWKRSTLSMDGANTMSVDTPLPGPVFTSPIDTLYHKYGVSEVEPRVVSEEKEYANRMMIKCRQMMNEQVQEKITKIVETKRRNSDSLVLSALLFVRYLVHFSSIAISMVG